MVYFISRNSFACTCWGFGFLFLIAYAMSLKQKSLFIQAKVKQLSTPRNAIIDPHLTASQDLRK
jgi:hypothetical protein